MVSGPGEYCCVAINLDTKMSVFFTRVSHHQRNQKQMRLMKTGTEVKTRMKKKRMISELDNTTVKDS